MNTDQSTMIANNKRREGRWSEKHARMKDVQNEESEALCKKERKIR